MKAKKPKITSQKTKQRRHWWLVLLLLIPAALVLIVLSIISAFFLRSNQPLEQQDSPTVIADAGLSAADTTTGSDTNTPEDSADALADNLDNDSVDAISAPIKSIADLPKPINDGNYQPAEVALEKTIIIDEPIYFTKSVVNDTNQARGVSKIAQAGVNGNKKLTYLVKYNSEGQSLAVEKISEEITKEPVVEITKVGVSDYNLNDPPTLTYYISDICLPEDATESGCIGTTTESYRSVNSFELSGRHHIFLIIEFFGPNTPISPTATVAGNYVVYAGQRYFYKASRMTHTEVLTEKLCSTYGLACGRW